MSDPSQTLPGLTAVPRGRRLVVISWVFAGIVVLLLFASFYSLGLLSAGRAFVGAEGQWSRAQKDAIFHLTRYALYSEDEDYEAFEKEIAVPRADRRARIELMKVAPDYRIARQGFIDGRVHPDDIDSMIKLFRRFRDLAPVKQALFLWEQADNHVDDLIAMGHELRGFGRDITPTERLTQIERITRINATLAGLGQAIAATLGEAQRAAQSVLLAGLFALGGMLLVAGVAISQRFVAQNDRLQEMLRESEAQLRYLIEVAPLPLLILRAADRRILYANERAMQQFALDAESLRGRSLDDFHVEPEQRAALSEALSRQGSVRDHEIHLRDVNGRNFWLLLSAQPIRYGGVLCMLAALANIDERKRQQDDMRRKALHDPLTGLPNRANFIESLERALRKGQRRQARFSVLFIDLDRFKEVNDTLGHAAGDQLLRAVADRLKVAIRQSDMVARLAGDEFVVLVEDHRGPEEVMTVAQKILTFLARPMLIEAREVPISASIGIASYPDDGDSVETLLRTADSAMYLAKEKGRGNFQFYSEELNRVTLRRNELERRVRDALANGEFFLQYQPEIDLPTGKLRSVEALLRWREPSSGVVMPADFLPHAEESGTILAIGRWVLDRALKDLQTWLARGLDVTLSVNVSARQLQHHELVNEVFQALQAHMVEPRRLRLEISESALMGESDLTDRAVRALQGLGVQIAIDNFGTAYSSLGLVRGFQVQTVKIDRSLVSSCPDRRECSALVEAVGAMARNLGFTVVAEGVETEEERRLMSALGCDRAQGYLLGRPVDASQIAEFAENRGQTPVSEREGRSSG